MSEKRELNLQRIGHVKRGVGPTDDGLSDGILQEDLIDDGMITQEEDGGEKVVVFRDSLQVNVSKAAGVLTKLSTECGRTLALRILSDDFILPQSLVKS